MERRLKERRMAIIFILVFLILAIGTLGWERGYCEEKGAPITIGVPLPLGSPQGQDTERAIILAAEEINAKGGVSVGGTKRPLKVESVDTREHEPGFPSHEALIALEKLITEKKPQVLIGGYRSEIVLAYFDLVAKYKIPFLTPIAMTPLFGKRLNEDREKFKYMFRVGNNVKGFFALLVGYMDFVREKHNIDSVYFVTTDVLAWRGTVKMLTPHLEKTGWKILAYDKVPLGTSDYTSSLARAKAEKAKMLLVFIETPEGSILFKQAKAMKVPALISGIIGAAIPETAWKAFKGEVEYSVQVIQEIGQQPVKAWPKSVEFFQNYEKRWGVKIRRKLGDHGPAPAYDAVHILANIIERSGTLDADVIVKALEETDYLGAVGRIRFDKDHNVIYGFNPKETACGTLVQWKSPGVKVPVFPQKLAEGPIELPAYAK